jgi:hypothetical protein
MNTDKIILIAGLVAMCIAMPAVAAEKPALRPGSNPIKVSRISPSSADLQKARHKAPNDPQGHQVHVVKLYVTMPPPGAELYELYIGDERIEEYGSFDEGIFFKSYQRKDFEAWKDRPVRFICNGETMNLNVTFPAKPDVVPSKLPELDDVLREK